MSLNTSLDPHDLSTIRFTVAALILSPVIASKGLAGLRFWQACTLALTGGSGFAIAAYTGFALAPASHGRGLIHGVLPLTTLLVQAVTVEGIILLREQPSGWACAGVLMVVVGVLLHTRLASST